MKKFNFIPLVALTALTALGCNSEEWRVIDVVNKVEVNILLRCSSGDCESFQCGDWNLNDKSCTSVEKCQRGFLLVIQNGEGKNVARVCPAHAPGARRASTYEGTYQARSGKTFEFGATIGQTELPESKYTVTIPASVASKLKNSGYRLDLSKAAESEIKASEDGSAKCIAVGPSAGVTELRVDADRKVLELTEPVDRVECSL